MQEVQASVYGTQRVLPALSRALHLESGIVGEYGLFTGDDSAAFPDDFVLVFLFLRNFLSLRIFHHRGTETQSFQPRKEPNNHNKSPLSFRVISCLFAVNFLSVSVVNHSVRIVAIESITLELSAFRVWLLQKITKAKVSSLEFFA